MLQEVPGELLLFIVPFMLLHMMPVWIYLGGVLSKHYNVKSFAELSHINIHRGIFDQHFNVGDVVATTSQVNLKGIPQTITLSSISNYKEVYSMIQQIQTDVYTDVMYPNALRPDENPGYDTKYKGL